MDTSAQSSDICLKKHKVDNQSKGRFQASQQALPHPLAWRYQRKLELLGHGQKQGTKDTLPNLYSLMDHLIRMKQPDNQLRVECSGVENAKKHPSKRQHSLSSTLLRPTRNTLKLPKVPAVPDISLSLAESSEEVTVPLVKRPPRSSLQLPKTKKSTESSPNSVCNESFSLAASASLNTSLDFNEAKAAQQAGIWQPWAQHLTPCHRLLNMHPPKNPRIHPYLLRLPKLDKKDTFSERVEQIAMYNIGKERENSAHCMCRNPFQLRNLRLLAGRNLLQLSSEQRKTSSLQQIIKPGVVDPASPVLILHIEGVLADIHKSSAYDRSPLVFALRPGAIEGLKLLSKSFVVVFLSDSPLQHFYKVMEFLIQSRVHICAAYSVQNRDEDLYTQRKSAAFQDYSQIISDLGITEAAAQRVMLLTALRTESIEDMFTQTGLYVRLQGLHLPVALPDSPVPLVTVLVPHMRLEDATLNFIIVAQELLSRFFPLCISSGLADSFLAMARKGASGRLSFLSTRKVHEAYYSYLLSQVHCTETDTRTECLPHPHCGVHPDSEAVARILPESHFILVASGSVHDRERSEAISCDFYSSKAKFGTLMEYVQSSDILD